METETLSEIHDHSSAIASAIASQPATQPAAGTVEEPKPAKTTIDE